MNVNLKHALLNADTILLATPMLACAAIGGGCSYLQKSNNALVRGLGTLGCYTCAILTISYGLNLIIWNCVKNLFARLLNALTFNRVEALRNYVDYSDKVFKGTLYAVPALALICLNLTDLMNGVSSLKELVNSGKQNLDSLSQGVEGLKNGVQSFQNLSPVLKNIFAALQKGAPVQAAPVQTAKVVEIVDVTPTKGNKSDLPALKLESSPALNPALAAVAV